MECDALIDTGSEATLVTASKVKRSKVRKSQERFATADGGELHYKGKARCRLGLGPLEVTQTVVVTGDTVDGVDALVGLDLLSQLAAVKISEGSVDIQSKRTGRWATLPRCHFEDRVESSMGGLVGRGGGKVPHLKRPLIELHDKDFVVEFDGNRWVAKWKWTNGPPQILRNQIGEYKSTQLEELRERYEKEVDSWVEKGWLKEWTGTTEGGVIPLMAVHQPTKEKVRPVMDYRELNAYVESHTGEGVVDVCAEKIRQWRRECGELALVDLRNAYLQIHIEEKLWRYQLVKYKGKVYALTRLGFGLTCAPKIMSTILKEVLGRNPKIAGAADHYIDDILVNESVVKAEDVRAHLQKYGLDSKPPERLSEGGKVLGLQVDSKNGKLYFRRGRALDEMEVNVDQMAKMSKAELFSICGKLVGHYPIAGWLRPACSYVKRVSSKYTVSFSRPIGHAAATLLVDLIRRVHKDDPVCGVWSVGKSTSCHVWTDASNVATGVVLEIDGCIVEDASWLRKESDAMHINVAELDAVGKGLNLAIQWGCQNVEIATDSRVVIGWLTKIVTGESRVRTKGAAEM